MNKDEIIRISGFANDSIVDGPGLRFTVFVQGCPHKCEGCHNPQTHDFDGGSDFTLGELLDKIKSNPLLDGVTFSGGEPFCKAAQLAELGEEIHKLGLDVVTYTGFTIEYLLENANNENGYRKLLDVTDILIDGPFLISERSLMLKFRGSANQRIIDVKKTLEGSGITEADI